MKLKEVRLKEREELEPLLVDNPDSIEEGMKILAHQLPTDSGPLDILALDADGVLTVIELKDEVNDGQLDQGLRYYDWARSNIAWLSRNYKGIDDKQMPRLVLIAPGFSEALRRVAKYTTLNEDELLDLKEYHALQLPNGEKTILSVPVDVGEAPKPLEIPSLEDKLAHIQSQKIRQLLQKCIEQLRKMNIEVKPIGGNKITGWYKGKRFVWMATRQHWFVCSIQGLDGEWTEDFKITTKAEWQKVFSKHIVPTYKTIEGR